MKVVLLPSELDILDRLSRRALQDRTLQTRLLCHDHCLQEEFCIPSYTWQHLCEIHAENLEDFCRQLYDLPPPNK